VYNLPIFGSFDRTAFQAPQTLTPLRAQSQHFHANQLDSAQSLKFEFDDIHRKEHCQVSDRHGSSRNSAETSSQAQSLQSQSLSLLPPTTTDQQKEHGLTNSPSV
jgi:hypothetical protein